MDFYKIDEIPGKKEENVILQPNFIVRRSKDLMVRGKDFYAIWDKDKELWSTDEYDVVRLIDDDLNEYRRQYSINNPNSKVGIKTLSDFSSKTWLNFKSYMNNMADSSTQLDEKLTFSNTKVKKTDYVSKRLPYPLEEGSIEAYDELMNTLYDPEERAKLEWAIGAIVSGDAKDIQKFIVLYGEAGSGKSTFLNIIQKLFVGYYTTFEAKALTSSNNTFSTESFRNDPLVAIQHDGDLSKIEDNTKLNSIVSHEEMELNEKYKPKYTAKMNCFLFMGTNKPVKISDANSGVIRRLIDVKPSLRKIPPKRYQTIMSQIDFELGAIAYHCLKVYQNMGKNYYSNYRPFDMMLKTDIFFNFVESYFNEFKEEDGVTLKRAFELYKVYCDDSLVDFKLPRHKFREELKSYFNSFHDMTRIDNQQLRSYYSGFLTNKFENVPNEPARNDPPYSITLDSEVSLLDSVLSDCLAQYATETEIPKDKWSDIKTTLKDLDTHKLHYVQPPLNHIVIDFDLKNDKGEKSMEKNLEAASKWPPTYSEFSKGGSGIHLHYIYEGDVIKLSRIYSDGIEVKVFSGNSSLRRKLTRCNTSPIATINSGLPLKGEKMINFEAVKSETGLRNSIIKNLNKEIHPGTKPSIDFIFKILEDAYKSGLKYDVTDMRPKILAFANNSTNQSDYCIKLVNKMQFASEEISDPLTTYDENEFIFFDVEVFPNLFVVVWKRAGGQKVKMINPTAKEIEPLLKFMLIGFNCRRYDNHILYARYIGYDNRQLYELSQKIINGSKNAMFGEAYNISYTDVYDFASAANKMSLKKWEIFLGIHHQELGLPWDEPVPEDMWHIVADYCGNDVDATEATFNELSGDWAARQILSELSGLSLNDTTNQHTIRIVFGTEKNPQRYLVYTDLSEMFPGYKFENGVSTYRGVTTGEGGYVYAEPGMYSTVAILDVASMHPTSIETLNLLGPYTQNYSDLKLGRVAIKHNDIDRLKTLLGGRLIPFIENAMSDNPKFTLKDVSNGLKTALNSAYGLTSASFENPFRDSRNKDNIVAKRGALFMVDLQYAVQSKGFTVAHIKTDSIKIPNATPEIINFVMEFGKGYGYEFEHEDTYEKFCLVNDAVYIAKTKDGKWTATGTQFAQPYVFKTLFSHEPIVFNDMCETKTVTSALYLDMNEDLPDVSDLEKEKEIIWKKLLSNDQISNEDVRKMEERLEELATMIEEGHNYHFVGKAGSFCPIKPGCGGGVLLRKKDEKYYSATGSKGYRWLEAELVKTLDKEGDIDQNYYIGLVDSAIENMSKFGDVEWFMSDTPDASLPSNYPIGFNDTPPWCPPCGKETCIGCSEFENGICLRGHDNPQCGRFDCEGCPNRIKNSSTGYQCKLGFDCLPF